MKKLNLILVVFILLVMSCVKRIFKNTVNKFFCMIRNAVKVVVHKYCLFLQIIHHFFTNDTITNVLVVFMVTVFKHGLNTLYDSFNIMYGNLPFFNLLFVAGGIGLSSVIFITLVFVLMPNPYKHQRKGEEFKDLLILGIFKFLITAVVSTLTYNLNSLVPAIITVIIFDGFKRFADGNLPEKNEKEVELLNKIDNTLKSPFEK